MNAVCGESSDQGETLPAPDLVLLKDVMKGAAKRGLCASDVHLKVLTTFPLTLSVEFARAMNGEDIGPTLEFMAQRLLGDAFKDNQLRFRSVSLERLDFILQTGIDAPMKDQHIFVSDSASKACEYGGELKAVTVYDAWALSNTYEVFDKSSPPQEIERLRRTYVSEKELDNSRILFSRLKRGIGTDHDIMYARWIPGDPLKALLMVFLVGGESHVLEGAFLAASDRILKSKMQMPDLEQSPPSHG
jgi:hypothetical protein